MSDKVTLGRIVHYRLDAGPSQGQLRPAMVVRVEDDEVVSLQVFLDGQDEASHTMMLWKASVSPGNGEGQWAWPERLSPAPASAPLPKATEPKTERNKP